MNRITILQALISRSNNLHLNSSLLDYKGIIAYHPEELVITVKSSTKIKDIQSELNKHGQALPFFIKSNDMSIGAAYANGAQDLSDNVLGVQIIDGNGTLLNFGGQVMKNVSGYDVARLLVGSKGQLALIIQISFKVMPYAYIDALKKPTKKVENTAELFIKISKDLKQVFDPKGIFN